VPVKILRGVSDEILEQVIAVLRKYESDHPNAVIDLYRQNSVSIRVRIMDPAFRGMSKRQRNDLVWNYLDALPEETQGDISMLVLLTPPEVEKSMANLEFDDPVPSRF
jgi:stress-induced morphogen